MSEPDCSSSVTPPELFKLEFDFASLRRGILYGGLGLRLRDFVFFLRFLEAWKDDDCGEVREDDGELSALSFSRDLDLIGLESLSSFVVLLVLDCGCFVRDLLPIFLCEDFEEVEDLSAVEDDEELRESFELFESFDLESLPPLPLLLADNAADGELLLPTDRLWAFLELLPFRIPLLLLDDRGSFF